MTGRIKKPNGLLRKQRMKFATLRGKVNKQISKSTTAPKFNIQAAKVTKINIDKQID